MQTSERLGVDYTNAPWPPTQLDSAMAIDPIHLVVVGADLSPQIPIRPLSSRKAAAVKHRNRRGIPAAASTSVLQDSDRPTP